MPDALLEGAIAVDADRNTTVDTARLERTSYARLVRKGAADGPRAADGPYAALVIQSSIIEGASPCVGILAGWTFTRPEITLSPRVALCRAISSNPVLSANHDVLSGELRAARTWDVGRLAIELGATAGAELLHQGFDTLGRAPSRMALGGHVGAGIGLAVPVGERLYLGGEAAAQTHFFRLQDRDGTHGTAARFAVRCLLGLGAWF